MFVEVVIRLHVRLAGDMSCCFESNPCFGRFCSCLLVNFVFFAERGQAPSQIPLHINWLQAFHSSFWLCVNHVGEL